MAGPDRRPDRPAAGNIPGGSARRARAAPTSTTARMSAFAVDSGVWEVTAARCSVAAASLGQDAAAVFYVDEYLPVYYEIAAQIRARSRPAGWKANAYVIFDYFSPTDFKFAGIDVSLNKLVMGHRDATGWVVDAQAPVPGAVKADTFYDLLVAVNGTNVTVHGRTAAGVHAHVRAADLDGEPVGLNKGMVGVGSDNSRGVVRQRRRPGAAAAADARLADELHGRRRARSPARPPGRGRSAAAATATTAPAGQTPRASVDSASTACRLELVPRARGDARDERRSAASCSTASATTATSSWRSTSPGRGSLIGHVDGGSWVVDASVAQDARRRTPTTRSCSRSRAPR